MNQSLAGAKHLQGIFVCEGTRSRAIHQQQYKYTYLFGAVCAALGQAVGLVLPYANTDAMHHQRISQLSQHHWTSLSTSTSI